MTLPRSVVLVCSLSFVPALGACQGKGKTPAETKPEAQVQAQAQADPSAPSAADPAPTEAAGPPPAPAGSPKQLGQHLADPGWFRKTMFGDGAKVLDTKRSEADDQGRFSSLIRFELSDTTVEACADHLQEAVASEVTNVQRKAEPNGRIQLSGSTAKYEITFVCGESGGKTIAYVSYQWT